MNVSPVMGLSKHEIVVSVNRETLSERALSHVHSIATCIATHSDIFCSIAKFLSAWVKKIDQRKGSVREKSEHASEMRKKNWVWKKEDLVKEKYESTSRWSSDLSEKKGDHTLDNFVSFPNTYEDENVAAIGMLFVYKRDYRT